MTKPAKALALTFARWANRAMDPKYEGDRGGYVRQADDWAFGAYMVASELTTGCGVTVRVRGYTTGDLSFVDGDGFLASETCKVAVGKAKEGT